MKQSASLLSLVTFSGLTLSGMAHALSGQVTDASGEPIRDAAIEAVGSQMQARTDAQGHFTLEAIDGAPGELYINAPGYSHKTLHLDTGQRESLRITLRRSAIEQLDVTATPFHASIMESAQPVTVVAGNELRRKQAATLGETLKNEVGVHSSYFGPVASSPIIRGLNGPRVLITQNGLDVSDAFEQDKVAELETSIDAYTLVDAELAYTFTASRSDLTVYLKGSNLTDEEARVHSSFLKDHAPLPGRGFSIGLRGLF